MPGNEMNIVSSNLVKVAGDSYRESGSIKQEILHSLYLIHGQTLLSALDLIDNKKVSTIECPSGRWVYRVIGGTGSFYTCLPNSSYCQCAAFKFSVLCRKDSLLCKHVLAAKLAASMNVAEKKEVTDDDMVDILMNV